jgi:hypothetical protein
MSTITIFKQMSNITNTTSLEVTLEQCDDIVSNVKSAECPQRSAPTSIALYPVSTYVFDQKNPFFGSALLCPTLPAFASHWAIVVQDADGDDSVTMMFHLILDRDGDGKRTVAFYHHSVGPHQLRDDAATVKAVGTTRYELRQLMRIGQKMIKEFGNYHRVFWNCQMFARCYLRVITGNDAVFDQWTSADVTNLFLCALIVPAPFGSTKVVKQVIKERRLQQTGKNAVAVPLLPPDTRQVDVTEERLFELSDQVIDAMIEQWKKDQKLSAEIKDSSDKLGLFAQIWKSLFH